MRQIIVVMRPHQWVKNLFVFAGLIFSQSLFTPLVWPALGAFLIIGFMLHNSTEGLAIVAPIARDRPRLPTLAALGALAGVPTILGAVLGGVAYSPVLATLFLSVGAGAIAQVVIVLYRSVAREREHESVWTPLTAGGLVAGMLVMYGTGLLVAG